MRPQLAAVFSYRTDSLVGALGAVFFSAHHVGIIQPVFSDRDIQVRGYPNDFTRDLPRDLA